jgi:hypothetical protein
MTRHRLLVLLAAAALVVGACSVPRDSEARIVTNPHPATSAPVTTTAGSDMPRTTAKVYFIRSSDDKLEAITTSVKVPPSPSVTATAAFRLEALIVDGPQEKRLESKIPNTVTFEIRQPRDDELIVILQNFNVTRTNRETQVLAFQQMVYTLTEIPEINSVQFSVATALYPVPLKSGQVKPVGTGVRRQDYDSDTIYTTTTTSSTTTAPAATTAQPATTPPGGSAPTSAPGPSR